jgi:hypothetical protein
MKALAYALTFYCLAAIVACAVAGVRLGLNLAREQGALPALEQAHAEAQQAANSAHLAYRELAEQQRDERGAYSAADAIRMSFRVQQAREAFSEASTTAHEAEGRLRDLEHSLEQQRVLYVPLGAILLIHVIGLLVFWPWRERREPKTER